MTSLKKGSDLLDEEEAPEGEWIVWLVHRYARIAAVESRKRLEGENRRYLREDERAWHRQWRDPGLYPHKVSRRPGDDRQLTRVDDVVVGTSIGVMMVSTFFVLSSKTPLRMLISSSRRGSSPVR